ncbi:uncharacterized protein RJT21DRAFT_85156 [Scheffersomyces amazonensis]|uniref:uncharacterized protein n=1 Tax=Scheffersomyces amazonensis TaxID=1078765 RepID=UPI00315D1F90
MCFQFTAEEIRQRKFTKRGLSLNVLLVGENGTGKKTFINTLSNRNYFNTISETVDHSGNGGKLEISEHTIIIDPNAIPIKLNVFITENFGFNLENSSNATTLIKYIENEYDRILKHERLIERTHNPIDKRIHVALYFIIPTGKGLNDFDIENMKKLGQRVNLIPVISKSDGLTEEELRLNKDLINKAIFENNIEVFNFTNDEEDSFPGEEDESEDNIFMKTLQEKIPFAVIGANSVTDEGHQVRTNSFAVIDVNDETNCDYKLLRNVLLGSHIEEFKDTTNNGKYEDYRVQSLTFNPNEINKLPQLKIYNALREEERRNFSNIL